MSEQAHSGTPQVDRLPVGGQGGAGRVLDRAPHLSEEQRATVLAATTGGDLAQIVGRAGAGNTTAAAAIAETYREAGYEVRGAAIAGKAAETLQQKAGIRSRKLHSWEDAWVRRGVERLHAGSVLVIDEAGMVDARQLGRVLEHAKQSNAKVILWTTLAMAVLVCGLCRAGNLQARIRYTIDMIEVNRPIAADVFKLDATNLEKAWDSRMPGTSSSTPTREGRPARHGHNSSRPR